MNRFSSSSVTIILLIIIAVSLSACSGSKSPVQPNISDSRQSELPESLNQVVENHSVLAVYDMTIDPEAGTFTLEPTERSADYHFPLTQLYPNVLKITAFGFTPNLWADIKLTHPFPGSGIDGFDPRVIAILPANPGVRFIYPTLGIGGNNAVVQEPDGYTALFDNLGGSIPGNVNPFKAYFKDQPYRRWSSSGATQETQRWQMNLAGFGGPMQFKLVVDVSSNYPNPPEPLNDNAIEPVNIEADVDSQFLTTEGGALSVSAIILNWHYPYHVEDVQIEAPDLIDGIIYMSRVEENFHEYYYGGTIYHTKLAPTGVYKLCIAAADNSLTKFIYKEFEYTVNPGPPSGNLKWAKSAGGVYGDSGYSITRLSDDSMVVTGTIYGTATFGGGEINETILTSAGRTDIFLARYNSNGSLAWAKLAGGTDYDESLGISSFSDDSIVVTGYFIGSALFGKNEPNMTVLYSTGGKDIFIAKYYSNGILQWAKHAEGTGNDEGKAVTSLSDHSTVITGYFLSPDITFGRGELNETVLDSSGNNDIFIARYDNQGSLEWAKRAGGTSNEEGRGLATLSDDSTLVTGFYAGTATFGPGETNETTYGTAGGYDLFAAKFNLDGRLNWVKRAGGTTGDFGMGITGLSDDSAVATGYFSGISTFGFGESNQTILTSSGDYDTYIAHFNTDGSISWVKQAGGTGREYGLAVTTLSDNATVVTGYFSNTSVLGSGELKETSLVSAGGNDICYARYNPDGTLEWAKRAGSTGWDWGYGVSALSDDSIVVTGYYSLSATFGPGETNETILNTAGSNDIFIARLKP